jgi:tRNA modification GTPase
VEQIGILRTFKAIEHADLVLMVCDSTTGWTKDDDLIAKMLAQKPHFVLANKCDLNTDCDPQHEFRKPHQLAAIQSTTLEQLSNQEVFGVTAVNKDAADDEDFCITTIPISAKLGSGIDDLGDAVERWVFQDERARDAGASLNARQGELCTRTLAALRLVEETVTAGMPQDCLATDLKTAVDCLSEICGEAVSEEIITNIFATFCIGK